jgi:hypothetical protein
VNQLWQDLRFGFRMWTKTPWLTFTVVLSLAIGIGVNSTAFSLVEAMFLRAPAGKNPGQLVSIIPETPQGADMSSYPEYLDVNEETTAFSGVLAEAGHMAFLTIGGKTELLSMELVSKNYFSVLELGLAIGRGFTADRSINSANEVIISYSLWRSRFGADAAMVGKSIILNRGTFTVVGVAPKGFRGLNREMPNDLWLPATLEGYSAPQDRRVREFDQLIGRLAPRVTPDEARAELTVLAARLAKGYPATNANRTFRLVRALPRRAHTDRARDGHCCTPPARLLRERHGSAHRPLGNAYARTCHPVHLGCGPVALGPPAAVGRLAPCSSGRRARFAAYSLAHRASARGDAAVLRLGRL